MTTDFRTRRGRGSIAVLALLTAACGLLLGPSAILAQPEAVRAADGLDAVILEVTKVRGQAQGAIDALNTLSSGQGPELTKNFRTFSKRVDGMARARATADSRATSLRERREDYLRAWEGKMASVDSPEMKQRGEERKAAVEKTFDTLQPPADAARDAFGPFLANLQDVQKRLSTDLSPSGMSAAAPIARSAVADGDTVVTNLGALLESLTRIKKQVATSAG